MVLQNKHKAAASRQYKKTHSIPLSSSSTSTSTSTPKETSQERSLRLGSNADRYVESDEEEELQGDDEEVDEELLAHQASEAEALASFLTAQQKKLSQPIRAKEEESDDVDVDESFRHLRIADNKGAGKKGKVIRGEREGRLEGEAKRAQAIRDLKDRFAVSSPPTPLITTSTGGRKAPTVGTMRKPPPLPGQQPVKEGSRGGEDFLDSLL